MTLKSFEVDQGIIDTLETLKKTFNVTSDGKVIELALGLAKAASDVGGKTKKVTLDGEGGVKRFILDQ